MEIEQGHGSQLLTQRGQLADKLCTLAKEFVAAAKMYGKIIISEVFLPYKQKTIKPISIGGVAGGTYLFALPGSPSACRDAWDGILKFQLDNRHRPCNLVELMPRLTEHLKPTGA